MSSKSRVLVVSKDPYLGLVTIRALAEAGFRVDSLGPAEGSLPFRSRLPTRLIPSTPANSLFDASTGTAALRLVHNTAQYLQSDVVLPADLDGVKLLARLQQAQNDGTFESPPRYAFAPIPDLATIELCDDKWSFYRCCMKHGIPTPNTELITSAAALYQAQLGPAKFIKPRRGANSEGVARLETSADVQRWLAENEGRFTPPWLLQKYLPGPDLDLSGLAINGQLISWTIQQKSDEGQGRHFVDHQQALDSARKFIESTGYSGVVHFDFILHDDGQAYLLEANPRFWVSLMHSIRIGVNFAAQAAAWALGEPLLPQQSSPMGHTLLPSFRPGNFARQALAVLQNPKDDFARSWRQELKLTLRDPGPALWDFAQRRNIA